MTDGPVQKVNLTFRCSDLKQMDWMSASDPMIVVFELHPQPNNAAPLPREVGRTEMIMNSNNPVFQKTITLDYYFEKEQMLRIAVFDVDAPQKMDRLSRHDQNGDCFISLGEIVSSDNGLAKRNLKVGNKSYGRIYIQSEVVNNGYNDHITMELRGVNIPGKDGFFRKTSDPFFLLKRRIGQDWKNVYKSEYLPKNNNPTWKAFTATALALANNDYTQKILMEVYDFNTSAAPEFIGQCEVTLDLILMRETKFPLVNKQGKPVGGHIEVVAAKKVREVGFLDYLSCGWEISAGFAIDFTASNKIPTSPDSLHYRNPYQPNPYQAAIVSIGQVVAAYDSDQKFPVLGFGAQINGEMNPCFFCNSSPSNPEVQGIQGILDCYADAINRYPLWGPTNFAHVINWMAQLASGSKSRSEPRYFVFVIITDGIINDLKETKRAIVRASALPLSIIIIGVGEADFTQMNELDSDNMMITDDTGAVAKRDIVQFVPYNKHKTFKEKLAEETLKELPGQFLSYMKINGITPAAPKLNSQPTLENLQDADRKSVV